jgi:hypothetical protein
MSLANGLDRIMHEYTIGRHFLLLSSFVSSTDNRSMEQTMITLITTRIGPRQIMIDEDQFKQLVERVRTVEEVRIVENQSEFPIEGIMFLEDRAGAFDFLNDPDEEIYSVHDLKVRYQ